jgi:hypothetical protein
VTKKRLLESLPNQPIDPAAVSASIPLTARLAIEIPKPKDWQAFQRACVLLFRSELNDPNAQEYGRSGQGQRGIDVLGRRNGKHDHYVGVQCRNIAKPMRRAKIRDDCRAALTLKAGLKELIFATTAPDDATATDEAIAVERELREEGHDLTVVVYGWGALQTLISIHEVAYNAFHPSAVASSAPQAPSSRVADPGMAALIAAQVIEQMRGAGLTAPPRETGAAGSADEDPALHARIDTYRDLFKDHRQPRLAEKGMLALLEKEQFEGKPWARYRIETNLGSIALELGHQAKGAVRYETAHALRPDDPNAIANLALARIIQGRFDEAIELARKALDGTPRPDHAIGYLLQAAARSTWQGDPESLVPPELVGSPQADLGIAEFIRRRALLGWEENSLKLCRRHPEVPEFKQVRAIATLSLAIVSGTIVPGGRGPVTAEELNHAADDARAYAQHCLDIDFADEDDLVAYLNNASVLLRFCGRHSECEALLRSASTTVLNHPPLRRLLALAQAAQGRIGEAMATLANDADAENKILLVHLTAPSDKDRALAQALAIDEAHLDERLRGLRWRLVGELAVKAADTDRLKAAVEGLRAVNDDLTAALLELRGERNAGLDEEATHTRLRAIAEALPASTDMVSRFFLAEELRDQGLPEEASKLLEPYVDLSRLSPTTELYLQSLAAARRDDTFRKAVAAASSEVREDPDICWTTAAHAWNVGDLAGALKSVEALLAQVPDHPRARLLKIEILIRQDRSAELLAELDKPLEELAWRTSDDEFRIASLLGHFGYMERAASLAYRLFLEHRDQSRAWMTLSMLVLEEGRGDDETPGRWNTPDVSPNAAVDIRYDDGSETFFIVEPDARLRTLDEQSWEPSHPLVKSLLGMTKGGRFVAPDGRKGAITNLRHKYVARLHYVMAQHEVRFPEIMGFRRISVNPQSPDGLNELIAQLKSRQEWAQQEIDQYQSGPWPIGVLAYRLGIDTIDASYALAAKGVPLKVAAGSPLENEAAFEAIRKNAQDGCVLDLLAFWTAWRLQALDAIIATCGPIHLPQSVMDRLRARREKIDSSARDGLKTAAYAAGKISITEAAPEVVLEWRDDVDRAIAWAQTNANVCPLVASEELPPTLRELLRSGHTDMLDCVVLAFQAGVLLVTDDLPTRLIHGVACGAGSAWLHTVFGMALSRNSIDVETHIRWTACLVDEGHNYLSVSGPLLARSLAADANDGKAPGHLFITLSKMVGGRNAEPNSHVVVCATCLSYLWSNSVTMGYRQPATGHLLRQLLRERHDDYHAMLRALFLCVRGIPDLADYIRAWARGHFISKALDGV